MTVHHPSKDQLQLDDLFAALSSPLRRQVIRILAENGEQSCGSLLPDVAKSSLTHHWRVLRQGGLIWQRPSGREYKLSLRREDIDARFPGLLNLILYPEDSKNS